MNLKDVQADPDKGGERSSIPPSAKMAEGPPPAQEQIRIGLNGPAKGDAAETMVRIVQIVKDQKALEKHHRSRGASYDMIQDSIAWAYDHIVRAIGPFMEDDP